MRAIEELMHEHRVIEVVLTGLERMAQRAKESGQVNQGMAEKALETLRSFVDKCHHAKEERNLFQLMAERGVPREGGPLGVVLHEHEQGRHHIETMGRVLPGASRGDTEALRVFAEHALVLCQTPAPAHWEGRQGPIPHGGAGPHSGG